MEPGNLNSFFEEIRQDIMQCKGLLDLSIRASTSQDESERAVLQVIEDKMDKLEGVLSQVQKKQIATQNGSPIFLVRTAKV